MALVRSLYALDGKSLKLHPTEIEAGYGVFGEGENGPIFQINTYGSRSREIEGKLSQTLQFDRAGAQALWQLLGQTYGFR